MFRRILGFLIYVLLCVIWIFFLSGCNTIQVKSEVTIDTQEGKKGNIVPHASFKLSFSPNNSK
jgi:hypothetical protein